MDHDPAPAPATGEPLAPDELAAAPSDAAPATSVAARPARRVGPRALATVAAGLVLMSGAAGAVGYLIGHGSPSSSVTFRVPGGSITSPGFGELGPFGNVGGARPNKSSISVPSSVRATESALVDVNTQLSYQSGAGAGTGIVLTSGGLVLTNNHVIAGATSISVTDLGNHRTYSATVVGYDVGRDVAVLRLSGASGLATATFATGAPSAGETVYTLGNAGGVGGTPTVTTGTITALGQTITAGDQGTGSSEQLTGMIQTDAPLYSGDSGGAMTDARGQIVGLDTAASATVAVGSSGQGYAVPADTALRVAHDIITGATNAAVHEGATAFVGVELRSGSSGAVVASVIPGSPAAATGLSAGSTITSIDGTAVTSASSLVATVTGLRPGQSVALAWTDAAGSVHHATLTLGSGPAQ